MKRIIKIPSELIEESSVKNSLVIDGCSIIEESVEGTDSTAEKGVLYIEEQVLLFMLEGNVSLAFGKESCKMGAKELTLLKKGTVLQYEKQGSAETNRHCWMMFCIRDELIKSFLAATDKIVPKATTGEIRTGIYEMNECLLSFTASLRPYFKNNSEVHSGQLRLKIMEMMYHLGIGSNSLYRQLIQISQSVQTDVQHIVEQHYVSPVSLADLAHLSGRSLSSFKRDFMNIYNMAPAAWIRKKRMETAKEMLTSTKLPISDICFSLGFENFSHFSRIFKEYHGQTPTYYRNPVLKLTHNH